MKRTAHVAVRLDEETLARIDALTTKLSTEWHEATRSEAMRLLIGDALARLEGDPEALPRLFRRGSGSGEG
jgi:hypothetical protein